MPPPWPSIDVLARVLHTCSKLKNASIAVRLHLYACRNGLHLHMLLEKHMFSLLVEAGKVDLAHKVFDNLPLRDESFWICLMNDNIEHGELRQAFTLHERMQGEFLQPNGFHVVGLIKLCVKLKDMEQGFKLHAAIDQTGLLDEDMFVGSALASMYVSFGLLKQAQEVCDALPAKNIVAWNTLITGYVHHGQSEEAFKCYGRMRLKGILPNAVTFACILKACSSLGSIDKASEIYAEINESGLLRENLFLANVVVHTYAKCGMLIKAQEVFDMLPTRDVVTWTALVAGYVQHGQCEEALRYFELMQSKGPTPNAVTFVCSLRACGSIVAFEKGVEIHAEVLRLELMRTDPFVGTALIDMYSKWGMLRRALEVFDILSVRNVVTWTALISGYVQHNRCEEALNCFKQMQSQGVSPNAATFACSLKACGSIRDAEKGGQIHEQILRSGLLEKEVSIGSALVDMYAKCGMLVKAQEVFDMLPDRNVVAWSALIMGYTQVEFNEEALYLLGCMEAEGVSPNSVTYAGGLKACGNIRAIERGIKLHAEIARKGLLANDLLLGSTLIDMYAKCHSLVKAKEVFDMLSIRNVVAWNTLINAYAENEHSEIALYHFEGMKREAVLPNAVTYACVLKACGNLGTTDKGIKMHAEIGSSGLVKIDLVVGTAMIDMYSKCGLIHQAQEVFDLIPCQNVVHWGALITGYVQQGEIEVALLLFDRMMKEGNDPDRAAFATILNGCGHSGFIDKAQTYFQIMSTLYGIPPTVNHYICIVDLLGRAGQLDIAAAIMKKTPWHPNSIMWQSMLSACRKGGHLELGRDAFHQAMQLDTKEAAAYVCMSNIYADGWLSLHLYQNG